MQGCLTGTRSAPLSASRPHAWARSLGIPKGTQFGKRKIGKPRPDHCRSSSWAQLRVGLREKGVSVLEGFHLALPESRSGFLGEVRCTRSTTAVPMEPLRGSFTLPSRSLCSPAAAPCPRLRTHPASAPIPSTISVLAPARAHCRKVPYPALPLSRPEGWERTRMRQQSLCICRKKPGNSS